MEQILTDNPQTLGIMVQNFVPQDLCTPDIRSKAYVTFWVHKFLCHQQLTVFSNSIEKIWCMFQKFYQLVFFVIMSWKIIKSENANLKLFKYEKFCTNFKIVIDVNICILTIKCEIIYKHNICYLILYNFVNLHHVLCYNFYSKRFQRSTENLPQNRKVGSQMVESNRGQERFRFNRTSRFLLIAIYYCVIKSRRRIKQCMWHI
jgi:hypothetical protein